MTETIIENKTKGEKKRILCAKCNIETNHLVLASVHRNGEECFDDEYWITWGENAEIVQCQGCESTSFAKYNWCSEDDPHEGVNVRIYPKRDSSAIKKKDFWEAPRNLRRIYKEAIDSFNNDCFLLCAVGIRTMVEGICADKSIKNGLVPTKQKDGTMKDEEKNNLEAKIFGLYQNGILTKQSADILHEHRYLGNDAAHDFSVPSTDELKLAIEIIENTLEQLYEIPEKSNELNRKRVRRKAT